MVAVDSLLAAFERNEPASSEAIRSFEVASSLTLPACYRAFLLASNGGEGPVGTSGYAMLWRVEDLEELNEAYEVQKYAPGLLLIGSDGGGEAFALDFRSASPRYVRVPFVGMSHQHIVDLGADFGQFIRTLGQGE